MNNNIFDGIALFALKYLAPFYKKFFYSVEGTVIRTNMLNIDAEALYFNAIIIQTFYRMYRAKKKYQKNKNQVKNQDKNQNKNQVKIQDKAKKSK